MLGYCLVTTYVSIAAVINQVRIFENKELALPLSTRLDASKNQGQYTYLLLARKESMEKTGMKTVQKSLSASLSHSFKQIRQSHRIEKND